MLGFKGLAWKSVQIPPVLPKPDVVALTGGYRQDAGPADRRRHLLRHGADRAGAGAPGAVAFAVRARRYARGAGRGALRRPVDVRCHGADRLSARPGHDEALPGGRHAGIPRQFRQGPRGDAAGRHHAPRAGARVQGPPARAAGESRGAVQGPVPLRRPALHRGFLALQRALAAVDAGGHSRAAGSVSEDQELRRAHGARSATANPARSAARTPSRSRSRRNPKP